jgi:ABC-2 type transport system ATP-binding protein
MNDAPVIALDHLAKTFHLGFFRTRVDAVRNATFSVQRGEVYGLLGHNGAGKTTTLKMLMGLIRPDRGHATILGDDIRDPRARLRVGFLPESPHFYDYLRPAELLDYFGTVYGIDRHTLRRRIPALMERVGLKGAEGKQLRKFSKGMLQRIGLAQALLPDSELVILDEPQSGLDPLGRKDVRDIIIELRERGRTVLFSSHILPDVEDVCDRVAIMTRGEVVLVGRVDALVDPERARTEVVAYWRQGPAPALPESLPAGTSMPGGGLRWSLQGHEAVDRVVQGLVAAGWSVSEISRDRAQLEDLFVRATLAPDSLQEAP